MVSVPLEMSVPIATARLALRPLAKADLDDVSAYESREDVVRYLPWPVRTREKTAENLATRFSELGSHRIIANLDPRNDASMRLCERLGMRREAHFRHDQVIDGEFADTCVYAILDVEWAARTAI